MKKIFYVILIVVIFVVICLSTNMCSKSVRPTEVMVQDSIRHYYPMIQGQELTLKYRVANIGDDPLVITDIQPSCGCISIDGKKNNIILPQKEQTFVFKFASDKFVGEVEHQIYIYGNIANKDSMVVLYFSTNVVPPTTASTDYEENYYEKEKTDNMMKGFTNGDNTTKGYYINDGDYPDDYEKNYKKYPWRERSEKYTK